MEISEEIFNILKNLFRKNKILSVKFWYFRIKENYNYNKKIILGFSNVYS